MKSNHHSRGKNMAADNNSKETYVAVDMGIEVRGEESYYKRYGT